MDEFFNTLVVIKAPAGNKTKTFVDYFAKTIEYELLVSTKIYETESQSIYAIGIKNVIGDYQLQKASKWIKNVSNILSSYNEKIDVELYSEIEVFENGTAIAAKCLSKNVYSFKNTFDEYFVMMLLMMKDEIHTNVKKKKINIPILIINETSKL